jgi:radical SAM protein with 4Fe4S-binding SPASM domain
MDEETVEKTAAWIAKTCYEEDVQRLNLGILGGEPLNNYGMIWKLYDRVKELRPSFTKDYGVSLPSGKFLSAFCSVYTNGDLLTPNIFKEIKARHIILRVNPTYESLDDFEKKIVNIKKNLGGCHIAVALNELNMERLPELAKLVVKHGLQIRTNRLYDGGNIPGYVDEYEWQMSKMFDIFLEADIPTYPDWIMESTLPLWEGPKNPCLCGKYFIVIDVDGTIRSCNPDPSTKVGHIDTVSFGDIHFSHRWSAKNLPECRGCQWAPRCQGGCPYTRKLTYGTYNHKSPFCEAFKNLFPKLYQLADKWRAYYVPNNTSIV